MIWIFDRKETEKEIKIVQKPYFYYLAFSIAVFSLAESSFTNASILKASTGFLWFAFVLFMLINLKSIIVTRLELSRHMKNSQVAVSGSRLSIKKPVTYTILKSQELT